MRLRLEVALLFIIHIAWIRHTLCDGNLTNSEASKWECNCFKGQFSVLSAYCLASCNCSVVINFKWRCTCLGDGMPRLASEDNDWSCFRTCSCQAGESEPIGMAPVLLLLLPPLGMLVFIAILSLCPNLVGL